MTKQTFQATKSLIKQHTVQLFQSNPMIQYSDNSFNVKPTKMLSDYGGRGLRPDPPSPTGVNFFQQKLRFFSVAEVHGLIYLRPLGENFSLKKLRSELLSPAKNQLFCD